MSYEESTLPEITSTILPESNRLGFLPTVFKSEMVLGEALVYRWMRAISQDYNGGYWDYFSLSNGGFYMAPRGTSRFLVTVSGNHFNGELSANTAGIVSTLYALCELANRTEEDWFINLYHYLRDYAVQHPDGSLILAAID